jgi:hypothetical protein
MAVVKPLTWFEALEKKLNSYPREVIEAFNECIVEGMNPNTGTSLIKRNKVAERMVGKFALSKKKINFHDLLELGYMDIEKLYENYGWEVKYHRPDYDENYEAYYTFRKGKNAVSP